MSSERPGRNDPCHCGSGNKYKKCHLEQDAEADRAAAAAKLAAAAAAAAAAPAGDGHAEVPSATRPKHAPKPEAATRRIAPAARRRSV